VSKHVRPFAFAAFAAVLGLGPALARVAAAQPAQPLPPAPTEPSSEPPPPDVSPPMLDEPSPRREPRPPSDPNAPPIDRFAPFIEGGAGIGYVAGYDIDTRTSVDAKTGVALLVGGGFMVHFTWKFGLGVEANYQTVTGTDFHGIGIGPILALAF